MEELVCGIIAEVLDVDKEQITMDLSIGDIPQWDSVGNLAIITALEERLDVEIPLDDLFDLTSVSSIIEEIKKLKG